MVVEETTLVQLCKELSETDPQTWGLMQAWLSNFHTQYDMETLSMQIEMEIFGEGEHSMTPLHMICCKNPPPDIVQTLTDMSPNAVRIKDKYGSLPLHAACTHGAHKDVLQILIQKYPESLIIADSYGRTPLHVAIQKQREDVTPEIVSLLCSSYKKTNPCKMVDLTGKFPLHYACAWGASKETLTVLTNVNPACIKEVDRQGFIPFHLGLTNCKPVAVEHLLSLDPSIVSMHSADDTKRHPLRLLGDSAAGSSLNPGKRDDSIKCIDVYLDAKPEASAEFVTALQSLPPYLREVAVVSGYVQRIINKKMSNSFHAAFLFFDFMFRLATVIAFTVGATSVINTFEFVDNTFVPGGNRGPIGCIGALYACGMYFLFRELVQIISLLSLNLFKMWFYDPGNWLDITCIIICFTWGIVMSKPNVNYDLAFRYAVCVSYFIFWVWIVYFLKSFFVGFAVFIGGVLFVVKRLAAFLMALFIILIAFSMMFYTVFQDTSQCKNTNSFKIEFNLKTLNYTAPEEDESPFCTFSTSLLTCYTMLLGEIDDTQFGESAVSVWFFAIFMFLVVILLANMLIAIVTDSYGVIKNERAAVVFWSNRLDFVAEIDIIVEPWKQKTHARNESVSTKAKDLWNELMENFSQQNTFIRIGTFLFIVLIWIPLGVISAGLLWPPQVREYILSGNYTDLKLASVQSAEVEALSKEVTELQKEIDNIITDDTSGVTEIKSQVMILKEDVSTEIEKIKKEIIELYELISSDTSL